MSRLGLGVLDWVIGPELADEAVGDGLAWEMRLRALPARVGVYFVLALCLFSDLPYREVMRRLVGGLSRPLAAAGWQVPASTALSGARRRIGEVPLRSLLERLCQGPPPGRDKWSHICGLLAVAWDGTVIDTADTQAGTAAFGKPGTRRRGKPGQGPFPQIRMVALVCCSARVLLGAAIGPLTGKGAGERALATDLLGSLRAGMLLLADRGFYSWQLWQAARATGAHLLWRVKANTTLIPLRPLPDQSWLALIPDPAANARRIRRNGARRRRGSLLPPDTGPVPGTVVRVIQFTITVTTGAGKTRTEPYTVITDLLSWRRYKALDLARGYASRWAAELAYRDLKTSLRGPRRILRARACPGLARQELWAYLVIYQAIRLIIARAVAGTGISPARYSFTAALHAIRGTAGQQAPVSTALDQVSDQILAAPLPERAGRVRIRAVKRAASPYPAPPATTSPLSQHATTTLIITPRPSTAPARPQSARQPQHHQNPASQPP